MPETFNAFDEMYNVGCGCFAPCNRPVDGGTCLFFLAKTQGPMTLKWCEGSCRDLKDRKVQTYHDKNGFCVRCQTRLELTP